MKNFFASLILFFSIQSAHATSLHPCTPRIAAMPTIIQCKHDDTYYSIRINHLMSDRERCQGEDYYEYSTAQVTISNNEGSVKLFFKDGSFSYTLSAAGGTTFKSTDGVLNLYKCASPQHGGFSVGN